MSKFANQNVTWEQLHLTRIETRIAIRFAVTGKLCYLFILRLVSVLLIFSAHLFAGFLNLYKQHFLLYCVRKWENQLKRFFLFTDAFCELKFTINSLWVIYRNELENKRKKTQFQFKPIISENWIGFTLISCFALVPNLLKLWFIC